MDSMTTTLPHAKVTMHARVTSHTPGRIRVRIKRDRRQPRMLQNVKDRLEDSLGAGQVEINHTTHSVLVHYDRNTRSTSDVFALLRDVGVVIGETARALGEDVPGVTPEHSRTGESIASAISDLDRRLSQLTGYKVDLKVLFPLTLGGIGVLQLARRGLGIGDVPAYVLLWYAFDSFWKFHSQADGDAAS